MATAIGDISQLRDELLPARYSSEYVEIEYKPVKHYMSGDVHGDYTGGWVTEYIIYARIIKDEIEELSGLYSVDLPESDVNDGPASSANDDTASA